MAAKLNITDKAISKWERGLSCPDISLLSNVAEVLNVSVIELLNGEKNKIDTADTAEVETSVDTALKYADKAQKSRNKSIHNILTLLLSIFSIIAIFVCSLCNFAINGTFTWSLIILCSVIYFYIVSFPITKFGKKGIVASIITASVLTMPFVYVLKTIVQFDDVALQISLSMSYVSIIFIWILFFVFKAFNKRKLLAFSISAFLSIIFNLIINIILAKILCEPIVDVWDFIGFAVLLAVAIYLFILDYKKQK